MALFMKQDFSPPLLSRRWIAMKFRPNVLIYTRENIVAILESGLLFREDSIEVEHEAPSVEVAWRRAGGVVGGWLTSGERLASALAIAALVAAAPPRNLHRWTFFKMASYMLVPIIVRASHRSFCHGSIPILLSYMQDYMMLVRRATACCREYAAFHARIGSVISAVEAMHTMLCRQQNELLILMSRATSSLLGNVPWLRGDVVYEYETDNLTKIHHAFLVVQSTLLKNIALAHNVPTAQALKLCKNHNEILYWIYNVLIAHLMQEFKESFDSLERMYRLLKNYGTKDDRNLKRPGLPINSWLYTDVHTGIAKSCLELKLAMNKCSNLDMFLDSCALNRQEIDLGILHKDIEEIIESVTQCLTTIESSQIRLNKMKKKTVTEELDIKNEEVKETTVVKITDKEPDIRDEVFYFVKTDDDVVIAPSGDITTEPGQKEKEATKAVLKELRKKLVKREDLMRERERQALAKTMPGLENVPEFPRQINYEEFVEKKGFICKIRIAKPIRKFREYKSAEKRQGNTKYRLRNCKYENDSDITSELCGTDYKLHPKSKVVSIKTTKKLVYIIRWHKHVKPKDISRELSEITDFNSEINGVVHNIANETKSYKFSKKDLECSSSDSDFELEKAVLLNDVRRYRAARKKNFPATKVPKDNVDESLKPIEYSFGTGMAIASLLQLNSKAMMPNMAQEEVFIGDGEVSEDSGNDEDA